MSDFRKPNRRRTREPGFSKHAKTRMQQRGIKQRIVDIIVTFADDAVHVGADTKSLFITKKTAEWLKASGKITAADCERLRKISVLVSNDNEIVTVQRVKPGQAGRRYRRS